jgi:uncharacterized protein YcbX
VGVDQQPRHARRGRRTRRRAPLDAPLAFDVVGRTLSIGDATLEVRERITRCKATMANPETGRRDIDTLATLRTWGHQDFGVYAAITGGGTIRTGDPVEILA